MKNHTVVEEDIKNISENINKHAKQLEGKTLLITGGAGFLGRYIVDTIDYLNINVLKKPCKIISIDNFITSDRDRKKRNNLTELKHNIIEPINIKGKIDYIIHAAGIASPVYYRQYPLETVEVAVMGAKNMLELAKKKKVKSFLYFSSSEIYGNPTSDAIPTKETYNGNVSSIGPRSCYDESKRLGETLCMIYYSLWKIPIRIVRPFNIYGPGMRHHDYRVIPSFILSSITRRPIPVHAKGNQTRTFCYISDAIEAVFLVLLSNKNGEVYNIGNSDNEITMNKLAKILKKVVEEKIVIKNVPYPKGYPEDEPQRRCPDLTKIQSELKYSPKVDLPDGLKRTYNWCKENWIL